jgi:hypothetical protein
MISIDTLQDYLRKYGWQYQRQENDTLLAEFICDSSDEVFLIVFQLSPPWLRICIPVYLPILRERVSLELSQKLLELNYASRQIFFAISEAGDISLCADIYIAHDVNYEVFEISIDSITYVAEESFVPLMNLISFQDEIPTTGEVS